MKNSAGGFHSIFYALGKFFRLGFFRLFKDMSRKNACKTCALGMGGQKGGMVNERGRYPELCKKTLQAMASDMQDPIPLHIFKKFSIDELSQLGPRKLDSLGRIPCPLYANSDDTHLKPISWDEAINRMTDKLKSTEPERSFFYFSGRSSNEAGFLLQLFARVFGTNHVNNCSYYCHQASGVGLTKSIGSGTATVTLEDVEEADLFILLGANPTSNHPRLLTSLRELKKRGGKVITINPVIEPGLLRFKVPSHLFSLLFGTKITDLYVQPHIGGDQALLIGLAKELVEKKGINREYIENFTEGFDNFLNQVKETGWDTIETQSGVKRDQIKKIAELYMAGKKVIFSWAMGLTHHKNGVANIQYVVNLALMRGMVGKPHAGLLPLRGHSNVQGMGTIGATPALKKQVFEQIQKLGVKVPTFEGYDTMACMDSAERNEMDFALCLGGNLWASNPDLTYASRSLNKVGMISYLNTTLNQGHFFARGKEMIILPVLARDEEDQQTTQESMFSYVRLSEGGPKRFDQAWGEVKIISTLGQNLFGNDPIHWDSMCHYKNIRQLIAKTIPGLDQLSSIDETKKEFTIPGRIFHSPQFKTESGKAMFAVHPLPINSNSLTLMTVRSEGQFNTVVFEEEDAFRGIERRDVILMNEKDLLAKGLTHNQKVTIKSSTGRLDNIYIRKYPIRQGNCLMYYPEANSLISRELDPHSKTPAFKSTEIEIFPQ